MGSCVVSVVAILMKSLEDLLTFSKCLGRLTSEVQSTYDTEHCWKQKICTNTQTLTETCFKYIYIYIYAYTKKKKKSHNLLKSMISSF